MTNVTGFHLGVPQGNSQGIVEDYMQPLDSAGIPFVIKSVDDYGIIHNSMQFTNAPHVRIFRWSANGFDLPNYSLTSYDAAVDHWQRIKVKLSDTPEFDKSVWLEVVNEPDKNRSEWLAEFCLEIAKMMIAEGYKAALFGWSAGEPEYEHWTRTRMKELLAFAAANKQKVAIALHEYSLTNEGMANGFPHLIGRYTQLLDACDYYNIPHPTILITEWGWTDRGMAEHQLALNDVYSYGDMYADEPSIKGAALWCLMDGWGDVDDKLQKLIAPIGQWASTHYHPPEPESKNLLQNPSFEDGWYHIDERPELQIPNKWVFYFKDNEDYMAPECRVLPKEQLPEHEQDLFVLDGNYTFKVFKGYGALNFSFLSKEITLTKGAYVFRTNCYPDLVMAYENGQKVYADDPESGKLRFVISNQDGSNWVGEWVNIFPFGKQYHPELNIVVDAEVTIQVGIDVDAPHGLQNNGWFFDAWSLEKVEEYEPKGNECAREPYAREYWVISPETSEEKAIEIFKNAFPTRTTVGFSYDDAGVGCGLTSKKAVLWNVPDVRHEEFMQWYTRYYPSVHVEFASNEEESFEFTHWPTQYKHINQIFGANPQYYGQFGLPGHEGIDIKAAHDTEIYSVADGIITDIHYTDDGHNYGIFLRVTHNDDYETTYAHLKSIAVSVGDNIKGGQLIGYADNTGNSSGSHLHITLKHPDAYNGGPKYIGYPYNIIDPTPYLTPLLELPNVSDVMFGIHASADGSLATGEADVIAKANPEIIKVLCSISPENISVLKAKCSPQAWIVRAFLHFGGRNVTPQQFFDWTFNDVLRTVNHIGSGKEIYIELHNEPNLKAEGCWDSWENGADFGAWLSIVLDLYKKALPNVKYIYPGLSPGASIPGVRIFDTQFFIDSIGVINRLDGVGVHAYWAHNYPMLAAVDVVKWYSNAAAPKPIFVTEASNNKEGNPLQKGEEYINFWLELKKVDRVKGVTYFVCSASNPIFGYEIWMNGVDSNGIAETVSNR